MPARVLSNRLSLWALYAFAATAVASISLQNFIWISVALFLFFQFKDRKKVEWPRGLFIRVTLAFLLSFFTAALWGVDPANSFLTVHKYLTLLLILLVAAMPLSKVDIQGLLKVLIYGAAFCALAGIFKHFYYHLDRIDSFSGDKMVFGGMLMTCLLIQVYFLRCDPRNWWNWLLFAAMALGLLLTETRGAWLGFAFGFLFLTWRLNKTWLLVGIFILFSSFFILPQTYQDRVKSIFSLHLSYDKSGQIDNSSQDRVLIWLTGWKIIQDHPWGVGQGNVSAIFPRYRIHSLNDYIPTIPHLHNNFLQILAQNGWIGLALYLFWIFCLYRDSLGFKTQDEESGDLNWTLLAVFSSVLVWGLTEYTFSHQFMNIQFFLLGLQARLWKLERPSIPLKA